MHKNARMNTLLSAILVGCFAAVGCGDDDDDNGRVYRDAGGDAATDAGDAGDAAMDAGDAGDAGDADDAGADAGADAGLDAAMEDAGAQARAIEVIATEFAFAPDTLQAVAGETLLITLQNNGSVAHSISFELPGGDVSLPQVVPAGDSAVLVIEVPNAAGTYDYYCPVAGHRALGMEGSLVVSP